MKKVLNPEVPHSLPLFLQVPSVHINIVVRIVEESVCAVGISKSLIHSLAKTRRWRRGNVDDWAYLIVREVAKEKAALVLTNNLAFRVTSVS